MMACAECQEFVGLHFNQVIYPADVMTVSGDS